MMLWNNEFQQINKNIFVAADGKEYDVEKIQIATARGYVSCVCPDRFTGSECTDCAVGYTGGNCATCSTGYTATSYDDDGIPECAGMFLHYTNTCHFADIFFATDNGKISTHCHRQNWQWHIYLVQSNLDIANKSVITILFSKLCLLYQIIHYIKCNMLR